MKGSIFGINRPAWLLALRSRPRRPERSQLRPFRPYPSERQVSQEKLFFKLQQRSWHPPCALERSRRMKDIQTKCMQCPRSHEARSGHAEVSKLSNEVPRGGTSESNYKDLAGEVPLLQKARHTAHEVIGLPSARASQYPKRRRS
jgi:hypothetical protein